MMRMVVLITIVLFNVVHAQEMRIGLLRSIKVTDCSFEVDVGRYLIYVDTVVIDTVEHGAKLRVALSSGSLKITSGGETFLAKGVRFIQDSSDCSMKLTSLSPSSKMHRYMENFEVTPETGRLRIVNLVSMKNYLGGVIESEGGNGRHIEYYKVQALMSRTYAIQNRNRHSKEGFGLCDGVHCQAYHNMLTHTPKIREAVIATSGELIVDALNKPLTTYFHANCGGQTCDASYVWNTTVPYCETFIDTFCIHTRQARWTQYVSKDEWLSYLSGEFGYPVHDSLHLALAFNFVQYQRRAFYVHPQFGIPLRDLRTKFRLKSTFFNVSLEGDRVKIEGRGFGHGVGLCQEGAMEMASKGYSYRQIAHYYFNDVRIVNVDRLQFFMQTGEIE